MEDHDERATLVDSLRQAIAAVPRASDPGAARPAAPDAAPLGDEPGASGAEADPEAGQERRAALSAAYKRATAILALRDHSRAELRAKLRERDHEEDVVDDLLGRLEDARLLDDPRFAESFVRSQREGRGSSTADIRRRLREKGVSDEDAAEALADAGDDYPYALQAARKKARSTRGLEPAVRLRRTLGVLARRGFSGGVAQRAVRQALEEEDSDD